MAFRKLKQKKYNGIAEYYNNKSQDKEVLAYYIIYRDLEDKPVKRKTDAKSLDEAKKILDDIKYKIANEKSQLSKEELESKRNINLNRTSLDELAKKYFHLRDTKNNTKDKQVYFNRVSKILGMKSPNKINPDDIKKLKESLKQHGYAGKTINETFNGLRAMFNWLIDNNMALKNPVVETKLKKEQETNEAGRVLSENELEKLFEVANKGDYDLGIIGNPTLYLFLKCLYYTGARPMAILHLKVQDIDTTHNKIRIMPMKQSDSYTQTVNKDLIALLINWIEVHNLVYGNYIFHPQKTFGNKPLQNKTKALSYEAVQKYARRVFDKLFNVDIPVEDKMNRASLYSLRRTAGTKIYKAKGITHAMVFLNHTSVKTTQKYLNVRSDIQDMADIL